jgi:hypothetical protein
VMEHIPSMGRALRSSPAPLKVHFTPLIPALWRLRQEDHEFKANLGYTGRPCLNKNGECSSWEVQLQGGIKFGPW